MSDDAGDELEAGWQQSRACYPAIDVAQDRNRAYVRERLEDVVPDDEVAADLGLTATEFASIVRLIRSQLDVSICRILDEQTD